MMSNGTPSLTLEVGNEQNELNKSIYAWTKVMDSLTGMQQLMGGIRIPRRRWQLKFRIFRTSSIGRAWWKNPNKVLLVTVSSLDDNGRGKFSLPPHKFVYGERMNGEWLHQKFSIENPPPTLRKSRG